MKYMITKGALGDYQVTETDLDKPSTFDTREEAEAAIEVVKNAIHAKGDIGGKSYKDLTKEINEKNRQDNNKKTTREYGLKR